MISIAEYNFREVEAKWQRVWSDRSVYEAKSGKGKKFFIIFAYPNVSGYLHTGHMRGYSYTDIIARYKRMSGYEVLFPVGTQPSGNAAIGMALKIQKRSPDIIEFLKKDGLTEEEIKELESPEKVVEFFNQIYLSEWKRLGFIADWNRFITTISPDYKKFIEWQFHKLKENKLLIQKPYFSTACVIHGPVSVDPSEMELLKGGNAEKVDFTLLKFKTKEEGTFIVAASLRPETVFGQTNLWIDPTIDYVKAEVDGEIWIISRECADKLKFQKNKVEILSLIPGRTLIGGYVTAPGIDRDIIILPSKFTDPNVGTGIVTSVPSDAPYDYMALVDLQKGKAKEYGLDQRLINSIKVIPIIEIPGYGDKAAVKICEEMNIKDQTDSNLEEATKAIYKEGFHKGVMNKNCGKYSGMPVSQAKDMVREELIKNKDADIMIDLSEEVVCRCGNPVVIKKMEDQWFIKYSDKELKDKAKRCISSMNILPKDYKDNLPAIIDWFEDRACTRIGNWLGTNLPFDRKWVIEPIADSTLYPAYYIVVKYYNSGELSIKDMNEEFFDYVFLGKGKARNQLWERIRQEFEYFYPLDINLGGKEHETVHFPVFIMNHVGIFPEKYWPKGIFVNWWVTEKSGGKLSKSKGGAEPIHKILEDFSADGLRLYYSHIGSPFVDVEWDVGKAAVYKDHIERFYNTVTEIIKINGSSEKMIDRWFLSKLHRSLKEYRESMEVFDLRKAVDCALFELMKDAQWYQTRGGNNKKVIDEFAMVWLKMLTPFIPHVCEELWSSTGKGLISNQMLPNADVKKIDDKIEIAEDFLLNVNNDVKKVLKLTKMKPNKITIFVAPEWKRIIYGEAAKIKNPSDIIKTFMNYEEIKEVGKEAVDFVNYLGKHSSELSEKVLTTEEETSYLKDSFNFLRENFKAEIVIENSDDSDNQKAKNSIPMKPAIFVE